MRSMCTLPRLSAVVAARRLVVPTRGAALTTTTAVTARSVAVAIVPLVAVPRTAWT
jgi:hypothetical protein